MKYYPISLFALAAIVASPAEAALQFQIQEDPMTDAKRGISLLLGDAGGLAIKCDENGPGSLYISFISTEFLGSTSGRDGRLVRYRIDKGEPSDMVIKYNDSTASIFDLSPGSEGGNFLNNLLESRELVVQLTSYRYETYTILFDTTGIEEAVAKSAQVCGDTEWLSPPPSS